MLQCKWLNFMLTCVDVQFVSDGGLQPNDSFWTWRNEETNTDYAAVLTEITILRQIFQVGDIYIDAMHICSFSVLNVYACTLLFLCHQEKFSGLWHFARPVWLTVTMVHASLLWHFGTKIQTSTSVGTDLYPHMQIVRHTRRSIPQTVWSHHWNIHRPSSGRIVQFWASGGAKFPKTGDSVPWTPMNCPAKFETASFILGREICNRTNTNAPTNKKSSISAPCMCG